MKSIVYILIFELRPIPQNKLPKPSVSKDMFRDKPASFEALNLPQERPPSFHKKAKKPYSREQLSYRDLLSMSILLSSSSAVHSFHISFS
jgi:hypothetical protein